MHADQQMLNRAIEIATQTHFGQTDLADQPYIAHPLRVMHRLTGLVDKIVGVLHDVKEDGGWTRERLRAEGFTEEIVDAIDAVSRRPGESYRQFILRAAANPIGRRVKREDLLDNLDLGRLPSPTEDDLRRARKYRKALALLDGFDANIDAVVLPG